MPHVEFSQKDKLYAKVFFLVVLFLAGVWVGESYQPIHVAGKVASYTASEVADQEVAPTRSTGRTYRVKPGDTVYAVSQKFNIHPDALKFANNVGHDNLIMPGQRLVIP
jgi:LysM repeat protein